MASILIIDDDRAAAKLLELTLRQGKHRVEVARDLSAARGALESSQYDLLVLDVFLPDGSGLDLLRRLRGELGLTVPVVVLTGHRQEEIATRAAGSGATRYVTKPFSPRALLEEVDRLTA